MPIRITCPSCRRTGRVPDNAVGKNIACPACKHRYLLTPDQTLPDDLELLDDEPVAPPSRAPRPAVRETRLTRPDDLDSPAPAPKYPSRAPGPEAYNAKSTRTETKTERDPKVIALAVAGVAIGLLSGPLIYFLVAGGKGKGNDGPTPAVAPIAAATPPSAPSPVSNRGPASDLVGGSSPEPANDFGAGSDLVSRAPAPSSSAPGSRSRLSLTIPAGDEGNGRSLSTAEIVEESEKSIALIKGKGSSGTAFLVAPGLIATNSHVIDDEFISNVEVRFPSADKAHHGPFSAELLYEDPHRDLAFLAVKTDLPALRVAQSYKFRKGEDITVIGNPGIGPNVVLENAISKGVMSTKATLDGQEFYQVSIAINPGNSGGPVFDSTGRVIGVATLKTSKQEALAFSIPIEDLRLALDRLASQATEESEKTGSRHRVVHLVKGLGEGGALYSLGIDIRIASAGPAGNDPKAAEAKQQFEGIIEGLGREVFPTLPREVPGVQADALLAAAVRNQVAELSANFLRLQSLYNGAGQANRLGDLQGIRQTHRRLITNLCGALRLDVPKDMLVAFDDHIGQPRGPQPAMIAGGGPPGLSDFQRRMLERGRTLGRPPGMPGGPPRISPRSRSRIGPPR